MINLNPVLGFHLFNGLLAEETNMKTWTKDAGSDIKFKPLYVRLTGTKLTTSMGEYYGVLDHYSTMDLNPFLESFDINYACQQHCKSNYPGNLYFSCITGCACDSFVDLNGIAMNSCEDYCTTDRLPSVESQAYASYINGDETFNFFPYMQWFQTYWYHMVYAGHIHSVTGSFPDLSVDECIDGCEVRGFCNNPPTDAPTNAPPTDAPTAAPTDATTDAPTDAPTDDDSVVEFNGAEQTVQNNTVITGVMYVFFSFFART